MLKLETTQEQQFKYLEQDLVANSIQKLRDDMNFDCKKIVETIDTNRLESYQMIKSFRESMDEFNIKVEVVLKKFKRLTCDWLKMQARLECLSGSLIEQASGV